MGATINEPSTEVPKSTLCLFLVSTICEASFDTNEDEYAFISTIFKFSEPVCSESAEAAELYAQQEILRQILESNQLYSSIHFDEVEIVEVFKDDLKAMMKSARKRPDGDAEY